MRVAAMLRKAGERIPRRSGTTIGVLVGSMALVLLLGTAAWAQSSSPTVAAATTTSTEATGTGTATTGATGTSGTVTTTAPQAPAATSGLIPPVIGLAPLNPAWKVAQMVVQVWPEYDQEAVLVIMNFDLPAEVPLPATLKFAIPTGASIAGLAEVDSSGNFTYKSYPPVEPGTDWDIATIQVQTYRSLEIDYYYDPGLPTGAGPRSFPLLLQLPLDATSLNLHVQEPARATDFKVQPDMQGMGAAQDGYTYAIATFSDVKAGTTLGYVVSYNKPDAQPSVTSSGTTATKLNTTTVLLAVIAVLVVFIGGMIIFYLYRRGGKPAPSKGQQRAKTPPGRATATPRNAEAKKSAARPMSAATKDRGEPAAGDTAAKEPGGDGASSQAAPGYCAACGEELVKNARFCPNCGEAQGR